MENIAFAGPIPAGNWSISSAYSHATKGPTVMQLQCDYSVTLSNTCGSLTSEDLGLTLCLCLECPADFNQDGGIDGSDIEAFFIAWEAGNCDGDTNSDGGVDGSDIDAFFTAWSNGGC